jgi:uncharacterized membrane protein SpoIIM required for sporulation
MEKYYPKFWLNASPRRKRIYFIFAVFIIGFLVTVIGSFISVPKEQADMITQQLNDTVTQGKATNTLPQYIFQNNFLICLLMFAPVVGFAAGMFILFDTGLALSAIASTQGYPVILGIISLVITPVFWIEFAAYSIAMSESIWLFRRIIQAANSKEPHPWRNIFGRELKWTTIAIGICAGLLVLGAFVETWLITAFG